MILINNPTLFNKPQNINIEQAFLKDISNKQPAVIQQN